MKKILLIILLFCCNKFILVAQQVTSNLTLVTTDLMTTEVRNQFSWSNVQYTLLRFYQLPSKAVDIMVDPGDELGGSSGGNNGGGSIVYCKVPGWSGRTEWGNVSGVITLCYICNDLSRDCQGELVAVQPTGGSGNNNEPFNWGNLGWGNLGGYFQTGFLNPPANGPIGGFGINSGYGGGATPNPKGNTTIVPPPTNPVDDPNGGTSNVKKDTMKIVPIDCDSLAKARGKSFTTMMNKLDTTQSYKLDSLKASAQLFQETSIQFRINAFGDTIITNLFTDTSQYNNTPPGGININLTLGGGHNHPLDGICSFSAMDIFKNNESANKTHRYKFDYLVCANGSKMFMLQTDSMESLLLYNKLNSDSCIEKVDATNLNNWTKNKINPITKNTYFYDYDNYNTKYLNLFFDEDAANLYANIDMAKLLNAGIKFYINTSNGYKEVNTLDIPMPNFGIFKGLKNLTLVTICK